MASAVEWKEAVPHISAYLCGLFLTQELLEMGLKLQ